MITTTNIFKAMSRLGQSKFSSESTVSPVQSSGNSYNKIKHQKFEMDRHLFLASPQYLDLKFLNNPWMKLSQNVSLHRALDQHNALVNTYKQILGNSHISLIDPVKDITELSFLGESIFAIGNKSLYGRLLASERHNETDYVELFMEQFGLRGCKVPENMIYEGSGETLMWNDKIIIGHGIRNTKNVVQFIKDYFQKEVIDLELIDPFFYHLDLALFPVSNNLICVCEEAFSVESMQKLKKLDCEILTVSRNECQKMALNSLVFGKNVVVHYEAKNFISELESRGYRVHTVDVGEFMKFGGGLKCLTFQHYL